LADGIDELAPPRHVDRRPRGRSAHAAQKAVARLEDAAGFVKAEERALLDGDLLVLCSLARQARDIHVDGKLAADAGRRETLVVVENRMNQRLLLLPVGGGQALEIVAADVEERPVALALEEEGGD